LREIKPPVAYQQHCSALLGSCYGIKPLEDIGGKLAKMFCKKRDRGGGRRRVIIQWESQVGENAVCIEEVLRCHDHNLRREECSERVGCRQVDPDTPDRLRIVTVNHSFTDLRC
jgi:hypothetical protein